MYKFWIDETLRAGYADLFEGAAELVAPGGSDADLATCDASIVPGNRIWDAAFMDKAPRLKVLSRLGVGYDNISVPAATERNIVVCYAPEAPMVSTAEHAVTLLLNVAKRVRQADLAVRADQWKPFFATHNGLELNGRTLGLVGMGRIGSRVARVALALGMQVMVFDPFISPAKADELGVQLSPSLESLLNAADVVSLHVPVLPETRNIMNAERFAQMKRGAILINTARGALVDEDALVAALHSGHLGGAGLDVFKQEPIPPNHALKQFDNVVITGHIASHTVAGHFRLYETAIRQALQVLRGEKPPFLLNPEIWAQRRT